MVPLCFPPYKAKIIKETAPKGVSLKKLENFDSFEKLLKMESSENISENCPHKRDVYNLIHSYLSMVNKIGSTVLFFV